MDTDTEQDQRDWWAECTDKERDFIDHLAATGNKRQSAISAGFKPSAASNAALRMLKRERVCKALEQRRDKLNAETATGPESIRRELWRNSQTAQARGNLAASNRALELLGKANGMFADKLEVTGKDGGPVQTTSELSDAELARRLALVFKRGELAASQQGDAGQQADNVQTDNPEASPPATH